MSEPSRSQIDRAGRRIRHAIRAGAKPDQHDLEIVEGFRALHLQPTLELHALLDNSMGEILRTRSMPDELASMCDVGSRPKTLESIVAKLCRSTTQLSRMQDIAGVRIVVPTLEWQDSIFGGLRNAFEARGAYLGSKDMRGNPDVLGYRAVHLVVGWDDCYAEIQLRTVLQQLWAQTVEQLDQAGNTDLKHGDGPAALLEWLRTASDAMYRADMGAPFVPPPLPASEDVV